MKEIELYFLLEKPIAGAEPSPLPAELAGQSIEASLWSKEEKEKLRQHTAYLRRTFPVEKDAVETFLQAYRTAIQVPHIIGIANPTARTAHHIRWAEKIFSDGLEDIARQTPPLHLWTGLVPVEVELSLTDLLRDRLSTLWLRTAGYEQFSLPNLAHPIKDLRETGWVHSLFEILFDWMYHEKRAFAAGDAIEIPERGRYLVEDFMPGVLALIEWREENGLH
ncbi:MAG: hypothetical protein N2253_02125 [Bacteroidia bacterium]|nr:hypothetical protein [Bacteroidia bacterium]MCX7763675.1 hypothetical protein [Bacteroidia bacterium]MDW8058297.1 hypothetical protein [Bacteroidia bacterium]